MLAVVVSDKQDISNVKRRLGSNVNKRRKIEQVGTEFWIFCTGTPGIALESVAFGCRGSVRFEEYEDPDGELAPFQRLLKAFLDSDAQGAASELELLETCPRTWTIYKPMVLFAAKSFSSESWLEFLSRQGPRFFAHILEDKLFMGCTHVGINQPIRDDDVMRRPFSIIPAYGDFGPDPTPEMYNLPTKSDFEQAFWCSTVQNGIHQVWAPRYTMFSRGNIKEKKRVLQFECRNGDLVVDMYAGIGYFTLSYMHNAAHAFCWEINPWSVEGLSRGLAANGHKYAILWRHDQFTGERFRELANSGVRAFVFAESNENALARLLVLQAPSIRHINLGLLPSARAAWKDALEMSHRSAVPTTVHVHENVHVKDIEIFAGKVEAYFGRVLHVEKVKTFAPDVWHIVVDVVLSPN